jgi:hypothetical protein
MHSDEELQGAENEVIDIFSSIISKLGHRL